MPKIVLERFSARLVTDDSRLIACTEWVYEDGMFLIFLTEPPYTDRELVAATKRICYVPAVMRAVLDGLFVTAINRQNSDRRNGCLRLPARRGRA